ncbi:hypothetical protein [Kaistella carnis]|uniref:hypothetical protein n=1 Tax=Kaistella carnis TaxID=1241979 RepID=UPI0028AB8825|nr:hypothetical protein [Kaistella carnis]
MLFIIKQIKIKDDGFKKERTQKGLEYAKGQGRVGGRKPKLKTIQIQEIIQLHAAGNLLLNFRNYLMCIKRRFTEF